MGFVGVDWDFEPNGSFGDIGSAENVQHYIDFFNNSRALMPRSDGYVMACAPSGVGALGGQLNDDPASPFSYSNRNTLTGETDSQLYDPTAQTNGINLFGYSSTGHMIPVIQAVGDEIDIIAYQGYNAGASVNRSLMYDAYAHYAELYGFKIAAGVHFPEEPWGPYYTYTHENVASLSGHIALHPDRAGENDGIMIWQLLLSGGNSSSYSYLNVADKVLNGDDQATAIINAQSFSMETYAGGAEGCGGGQTNSYCGHIEYDSSQSYPTQGTLVYYDCAIWQNQWWVNPGESPGSNMVWTYLDECTEGPGCSITNISVAEKNSIYIHPNPSSGIYQVQGNGIVSIFNVAGEAILVKSISGTSTIDLSNQANGIYTLQLQTETVTRFSKIVKD
jgi:chitinase